MTAGKDIYPTSAACCAVFNAFLSFAAIVLNIITIHALRKTSSLPKPLKTLLLSLAVCDLGVGLLVQPLYIAVLVMGMQQNTENNTYEAIYKLFLILGYFLGWASFFGVFALSTDRFLAIHLHLRYQELVTHKRVVAVVILILVFSGFLSLISLEWFLIPEKSLNIIYTTLDIVCYITTALLYCKIYKAVRRHINQIEALHVEQVATNGQMTNAARLRKTAVGTFCVYLALLVCSLPYTCTSIAFIISGPSTNLYTVWIYTETLFYLNSSLNPLIYCWKMQRIRHVVMDILRNIFSGNN